MKKQENSGIKILLILISILLMFATSFIAAPAGLSQSGFRVLGTLIGALLLWLFVDVGWTSLLVLFSLMTIPEYTVEAVTAGSIGNTTVFFVLLCFILSVSLTKTGIAKRVAVFFMTSRLGQKSPWYTVGMIMVSVFVLSSFMSSTALMMIFIPIVYEIFKEVGYTKEENAAVPSMIMLSLVVVAQIAQSTTPISHVMTLIGFNTFASYYETPIDFFTYCAICIPIGILCAIVWFLLCRFVWKPDVSPLERIDFNRVKGTVGTLSKAEKITAVIYVTVVLFWILPGLSRYLFPSLAPYLSLVDQCYPPLIGVFLLVLIRVDGEPILDYKDALKTIPWSTIIFMGAIMMLGSAVSNKEIGMSAWVSSALAPVIGGISPLVFVMIMVGIAIILTNFVSNAVAIAVVFAIGMPLGMSVYAESINVVALGILMISGSSYAFATPPATPPAAVVADSGWIDTKKMFTWGMLGSLACIVIFYCIGIPLANLIAG